MSDSFMLGFRRALRRDTTLPPAQKNVLRALADFANGNGYCFPFVETIASAAGLKDRQTRKHLRALDGEWVKITTHRGRHRASEYQLLIPEKPALKPALEEPKNRHSGAQKTGTRVPEEDGVFFEHPQIEDGTQPVGPAEDGGPPASSVSKGEAGAAGSGKPLPPVVPPPHDDAIAALEDRLAAAEAARDWDLFAIVNRELFDVITLRDGPSGNDRS